MKQDLRVSISKRMIKEALIDLLRTKTLNKIKINELCEKSDINRATFYRHYESLQAVLLEIEMDFIKNMPQAVNPPSTIPEAHKHMENVCTYIYEHSDLVKLLFINKAETDMIYGMNEFYKEFLAFHKDKIQLQNLDEDTIQIIIALLGGGGLCLLRKWILYEIHKTPAEIATILCNVIRLPGASDFFLKEID